VVFRKKEQEMSMRAYANSNLADMGPTLDQLGITPAQAKELGLGATATASAIPTWAYALGAAALLLLILRLKK